MYKNLLNTVNSQPSLFNKTAIKEVFGSNITYGDLMVEIDKKSNFLLQKGVKKGDFISLVSKNTISFVTWYFAVHKIEAILIPLSDSIGKWEIRKLIQLISIDHIIFSEQQKSEFHNFECSNINVYLNSFLISFKQIRNRKKEEIDSEVSILLRTSGSIGNSKIVMHTNESILTNALAHSNAVNLNQDENTLVILPLTFSFAHTCQMLAVLFNGGTINLLNIPFFSPETMVKVISQEKITSTSLVFLHLKRWEQVINKLGHQNIETLNFVCYAGGPTSSECIIKLSQKYPKIKFLQAYGLTEAGPRVTIVRKNDTINPSENHHSGQPVENVLIEIRDENNITLPIRQQGEVFIKSPSIMKGYYMNEKLTNEVLTNGWLKTGDIGFLDEKNRLSILSRKKNIIITMGSNVYPEEIEEYLLQHPYVGEVLVLGEKDNYAGEIIVANVVRTNEIITSHELINFCKEGLAIYKVPKIIRFVEKIPRTNSGKIIRAY